jgi:hypothetical protein
MAYEGQQPITLSLPAGENLTAKQFTFVKMDTDGTVIACTATTDRPLGVLQNSPNDGQVALVCVTGTTKVVAGGSASVGNPVFVSASATAITAAFGAASAAFVLGTLLEGAAAGQVVSAVINCAAAGRGA